MRRGSLALVLGVLLLLTGVTESWYYAADIYPPQQRQAEMSCLSTSPPSPCATLAPAQDQGPFVLGEIIAAIGVVLVALGGLRFLASAWPPTRRPQDGDHGT